MDQPKRQLRAPVDGPFARELIAVAHCFNRGDFARAGALSRRVCASTDSTELEREFAEEISYRTGIDPMAYVIGSIMLAALSWVGIAAI